jgi:amidohydrolase
MLMGIAQILTGVRDSLPGNVLFIFQPAEEGAPAGEEGGAELMLKQGLFDQYHPQVIFGMHVWAGFRVGDIAYRAGPVMAASDSFNILSTSSPTRWKCWARCAPSRPSRDLGLSIT